MYLHIYFDNVLFCTSQKFPTCQYCLTDQDEEDHIHRSTPVHIFNHMLYQWVNNRKKIVKNRHGCEVKIKPIQENGMVLNYSENAKNGKHSVEVLILSIL